MYFKKLELLGFKSFAEKTKLHFEPGVTAIVGPNGCGKSNISDAIKWAFGEQAPKSLRASRMEDVIFNGTEQAEPINLAEVSVTFDNQSKILPIEYDEVTITRRLFRSGDSEYLLNKQNVRLRDINDLLMGTGIGTESYSHIEQGQIDLILSSKPEERRYIFEEASGITKYKSRKKEALNKLAQTENNLLRINDIITEVKRQIGSIERQARKAERYKQEFEKLKEMDTKFSYHNYKNLKNEEKITYVEMEDIKGKEKDILTRLAHFSEVTEKLKSDLERISDNLSSLQGSLMEASTSLDKNSHTVTVNKERIKELSQQAVHLTEEIKNNEDRRKSVEESLNVFRLKVENFTSNKEAKESLVNEKETEFQTLSKEIEAHTKDIIDGKSQTVENLARQSKLNNETTRMAADIQNRSARLRRLKIEIDKVSGELESVQSEFDQIDGEANERRGILNGLNADKAKNQEEFDSRKNRLETLKNESTTCQKEISLLKSRLQFLEELVENYEGFDKGARHILQAKKEGMFEDVTGPLCDIIDVEDGREGALELALGDNLQSFIVKDSAQAKEVLEYLESNNLGWASVIMRDEILKADSKEASAGTLLKPLADFVKGKVEYIAVLDYLLGDIYVLDKEDTDPFELIKELSPDTKIITAGGKLIQKGRVCGGSARESTDSSLLGREKKMHQARFKIETFGKKFEELDIELKSEETALESSEKDIGLVNEKIRKEEITLANINTRKQSVKDRLDRLNDEKIVVDSETEELKELLEELGKRQIDLKEELKDSVQKQEALETLIVTSQGSVSKKSSSKEELLVELTQYKTELASLSQEEENQRQSLLRDEAQFNELVGGIENKKRQLEEGSERMKQLEGENTELESENVENSSRKEKLKSDIDQIRAEKAELMEKVRGEEQNTTDEKSSLEHLREELHKLEIKRNDLSYKQTSIREKVLGAYKLDLDEAQLSIEEGQNWEDIHIEIDELKAKLEKMGTVNLVAIEEHQELQERFNFLTHQEQDLLNAKESLMKAIQKINKTTRSLFLETFTRIQEEFRGFFRLLFGGGQAELLLLDERDILESGIEIIVRPPGKKLQNISLLSGGEKSLTAIALLFAIFKVKPSPFCILDEIDAALDESNVGRFTNVLKDFVKTSQFIIITHNKKTIRLADVMYGITMEKQGISRIVSVKFADSKKEEKKTEILA